MNCPATFPLARYRFEFQVTRPIRLPDYAGSMLRGAFGHALRQVACLTRQPDCAGCPLAGECPYPAVFVPTPPEQHPLQRFSEIPVPYVIEAPAWGARTLDTGQVLVFHQVLIGRACQQLSLIILAWRRALARGVGAGDGTAELRQVVHCGDDGEDGERLIYRPEGGRIAEHRSLIRLDAPSAPVRGVTLRFITPLRLQHNGRALPPAALQPVTLLMALARRVSLVAEFHGDSSLPTPDFAALKAACAALDDHKALIWRDWARYSSRQRQAMRLGGVVGDWRLDGNLAPFAELLRLGEWLHVGKETAFGLGQYRLCPEPPRDILAVERQNCQRPRQAIEKYLLNCERSE
ncbi:MAG TPA: CRISPR system precrRNA processing endoribonuclease RAMP protein Cas6 [Accumulibacter sp.]|nr:CRISPR system precrRNA processing endoribonuclease RAMP protein Cas6 [Accumulibacter sp.]HNC17557.1 CRISPR system precrRNA processing endoribonuclease RAMP protein Cas6 [Accumulibacter sp.]HNG40038.1 CRISPR system precrRNA processing endoribonuclease RAMP protein Cas6 [Accumulibacter sp.]HNL13962.1 CRISPR system precrRNA processing endoribonuclease RAMP protein Cas6 [Accumulibacter sp.]HNL77665.1 CRISPR system precrRNA processing endoribonuclease RAMP protein Cas6 [Accumulibacter sp.]